MTDPDSGEPEMMMQANPKSDRLARWAGDLDHPFYDDEHNRHVSYEASTIAFQIALVGNFFAGAIAVLIGGYSILGWVILMITPATIGSLVATGHMQKSGVAYAPSLLDFRNSRGLTVIAAVLAFALAIAISAIRADEPIAILFVAGLVLGFGAGIVGAQQKKRQIEAKLDALDEI